VRLDWIKVALEDVESERYQGWDRQHKCYDTRRRVTLVMGDYVVVIALKSDTEADFITAYVADSSRTLAQIRKSPKWT